MPMPNKMPKFFDKHKICIICEGNEEYQYLKRLKDLKVWNEQYDISLVNAGGNGNIPARYQDRYQNGADEQNVFNVTVTICISLLCRGHLIGIGIGTVCAVIGVGRTIAVFNHFTKEKMTELAGIEI